jgi:hypothetical protein
MERKAEMGWAGLALALSIVIVIATAVVSGLAWASGLI